MTLSKLKTVGYELSDVNIVQADISFINHRAECNPYVKFPNMDNDFYPVVVSPMGAVTNEHNYKTWLNEKFMCVVPRTVDIEKRLEIMFEAFASFSLNEAEDILRFVDLKDRTAYVCIDIAHGTMNRLYEVCKDFKFWIIWNDHGMKKYFCPEPSTWIIDAPNQPIPADESGYLELAPGESKTLTEKIYTMQTDPVKPPVK